MKLRINPVICVDVPTGVDKTETEEDLQKVIKRWARARGFELVESRPVINPIPIIQGVPVEDTSHLSPPEYVKKRLNDIALRYKGVPCTTQTIDSARAELNGLIKDLVYRRLIVDLHYTTSVDLLSAGSRAMLTFKVTPDIVVYEE